MGKVDDQRAMREARYAASRRTAAADPDAPRTPAARAAARPPAARATAARPATARSADAPLRLVTDPPVTEQPAAPAADEELCGHRSIGNKRCTREKDHQATGTKNHRYG